MLPMQDRMENPMPKTFDSKCYDLAEAFLEDQPGMNYERLYNELAIRIQQTVEDFIAEDTEARAEAAWERQQQSLMESGGTDDSHYRQQMKDAGRGHLLR